MTPQQGRPRSGSSDDGRGRDARRATGGRRAPSDQRREAGGRRDAGDRRRASGDRRDGGGRGPSAGRDADRSAGAGDRGGPRLAPRKPRLPEPRIADGVTGKELDREVRGQLRTLSVENAEGVAQHLVMTAMLLAEDDLEPALAHAETAVRRAGRVPAAREALGMVAYRMGDYAKALAEFRTVRRLSGSSHLLPLMVDCERGLGRLDRALDLASSPEAATLAEPERVELAIVVSGIRRDLGQPDAALVALQQPMLRRQRLGPAGARLAYAYADALLEQDRRSEAREWFAKAADADTDLTTDAAERLEELDGVVVTDLLEGESEDAGAPGADADRVGEHTPTEDHDERG